MKTNSPSFEQFVSFLGQKRNNDGLQSFISQFVPSPVSTVDREDGADDEFLEFKEEGFGFYFEKDILESVFLHSAANESDYRGFEGILPLGIRFEQSKSDLLNMLGSPEFEGGGQDQFFGEIPPWFKYKVDSCTVHVEFSPDLNSILFVTLARK